MKWPPNKAWTSSFLREGYRHFVAINYGGKGLNRWVGLVSVLDANSRFKVPWEEMKNSTLWVSGWLQLPREQMLEPDEKFYCTRAESLDQECCLHPSVDSGLMIPSNESTSRSWLVEVVREDQGGIDCQ